ncbi:hypothetical protein AOZ07_04210 [Glutamicibacter halophytocola]|uniref:prepilin peptidase n=1 Tax=Glutamicibacter halophytocola TaxID=1933880 RepID=UPI0006D4BCE2|nr:prepilin peptidase [Glutamicibacter halophytocola]ALG28275.1 hypothetical protein AOZ07_04210 [Glutamicibacter halophytocola]
MSQIWSVAQEGPIEGVLVALQLLCFGVFGVLLSKADIASHRLPNRLVGSWLLASLALVICLGASSGGLLGILQGFLGMLLLGGGYLLISLISAGAMGMGDVKLAGVLGLNLGYYSLPALFLATLLTFVLATFWVIGGVIVRKLTLKSAVPFGPFMVIGAFAVLLVAR